MFHTVNHLNFRISFLWRGKNLALVEAQCYRDTQIQEFDLEVISIVKALDKDLDCYTSVQILSTLGDQYDSPTNTDRWPRKSKLQEIAEEVGQLKALQRKQGRYDKGQRNINNHNGSNDHANRTHADNNDKDNVNRNTPEGNPAIFGAA
jgi:hypothetical protein